MKALILAAGVGSRLKPLTDATPKALIPVGGIPMLERALVRLKAAGVKSFVVNAHHHPQKVADFCADLSRRHGVPVSVSREDDLLLDTGGAIKKASALLKGREPFFVHNADVLTDLDLRAMLKAHKDTGALATLAVRERESGRSFIFDAKGRFAGHDRGEGRITWAKGQVPNPARLPFDGVHLISPELLDKITEGGVFSIIKTYLRLAAAAGADIRAFRSDQWAWHDIGTVEKLAAAEFWVSSRPS